MEFGASIFFTDYSITPGELAVAMEERGFDSVWPPSIRTSRCRADSELGKRYYDEMDPFVTLTAAACATNRLKIATGICLVIQRDTSRPPSSSPRSIRSRAGRFLFGIGGGWNKEEIENHGTVFATRMRKMREQIEAMKAIWTDTKPEYHGDLVDFGTIMTWPKPVQQPHPPVILGGAFPWAARRDPLWRRLVSERRKRQSRGNIYRHSARWHRTLGAIQPHCRSRSARPTISTS